MQQKTVILLLSGGKDSLLALKRLLAKNYRVIALCISGKEKKEEIVAKKVAAEHGIPLYIMRLDWFEEKTYSFLPLIGRNMLMLLQASHLAVKYKARFIAAGVKKADSRDRRLFWIPYFAVFCIAFLFCFGRRALLPVWRK